jgi:hypothetical protein
VGDAAPSHALAFLRTCPPDNDPLEFIFGDLAKEFSGDEEKVLCALIYFSLPARVEIVAEIAGLEKTLAATAFPNSPFGTSANSGDTSIKPSISGNCFYVS